jgi:sugar lactone lactonase YvrE
MNRPALLAALLAIASLAAAPATPTAKDLADRARSAYRDAKYEEAYRLFSEAVGREPSNWRYRYNLAFAATKTKRFGEAAAALSWVVGRGIDLDTETVPDLAPLRAVPEYAPVRRALGALSKMRGPNPARPGFTLPERDLLTEGIAFDPATGDFFVSSVHRRKILRRRSGGAVDDFVGGGSWGVLALRVDPERRVLWAATAALPQMLGFEASLEGKSRVDAYDLGTGKRVRRVDLPGPGPHVANDLALDRSGRVFVSDSVGSAIYRIAPGSAEAEILVPPKTFASPQGMALDGDGTHLYVADYGRGVFRVELATGRAEELPAPPDAFLLGIDGLDRDGDALLVTQNLAHPDRVSRLYLAPAGDRIVRSEVLELNDPRLAEPTLGVVAHGSFWFVAASQWSRFDEKTGLADGKALRVPTILELPLARPRSPVPATK